jgi:aspartyl-tRNA(Asn)/glutamyl-tRNA(Gln) amidotransferase subunit C
MWSLIQARHLSGRAARMLAFRMPVHFSTADVQAIAALAQLELSTSEIDLFARQLGEFLEYANQVLAIDTTDVEPTASVMSRQESDRPDEVRPSLDRREVLAAAPDAALDAGFFKVPRVIG